MTLLDLLSSLPGAPGTGLGPGSAIAGGLPAVGAGSPPMCGPAPEPDGPAGGSPGGHPGEPDHTPDLGFTPAPSGTGSSWEPAPEPFTWGENPYYPDVGDLFSMQVLDRYGAWVKRGSKGWRAFKSLSGLVVLPVAAVAVCFESSVRTPFVGGGITK